MDQPLYDNNIPAPGTNLFPHPPTAEEYIQLLKCKAIASERSGNHADAAKYRYRIAALEKQLQERTV